MLAVSLSSKSTSRIGIYPYEDELLALLRWMEPNVVNLPPPGQLVSLRQYAVPGGVQHWSLFRGHNS